MRTPFSAPLLLAASALLGGAVAIAENGETRTMLAGAGVAAGMIALGAYIARQDD